MSSILNTTQRPWSESSSKSRARTRTKKVRAIKLPEIYQEAQTLTDTYWKDLLSDLACGIFPSRMFSFEEEGIVLYRNRSVMIRYAIPEDPSEAITGLIEFFKERGERSEHDRIQDRISCSHSMPQKQVRTWSDVTEKNQARLREWFVQSMQEKYQLNSKETDDLRTELSIGLMFKAFDSEDIRIENGVIVSVSGLEFDPITRSWIRSSKCNFKPTRKSTKESSAIPDAPQFYHQIGKSFQVLFESSMSKYRASFRSKTVQTTHS